MSSDTVPNVLFHGGEPTLAKRLIFTLVPEIQRRAEATGKKVFFSIQTNGTQLDEELVRPLRGL